MLFLSSSGESVLQLIFILFVLVAIIGAAGYTTKWIAGYQKAQSFNHNLEIVETIKLTTNKYIQIVRAGKDKYYAIAIGKDEITLLGELDSDDLMDIEEKPSGGVITQIDFKSILEKVKSKK